VIWQNRAFNIVVTQPASGSGSQQSTVTLVPALNQSTTGQCVAPPAGSTFWDLGLRGDHGPNNHASGFTFSPQASVLTDITSYPGGASGFKANTASFTPGVVTQACNGSKIPPEAGVSTWYQVPPGTFEGNVPTPVFNLTAGATVDEGNNWVNISWGPLSLVAPTSETNPTAETMLSDYRLADGSPAINYVGQFSSPTSYSAAPPDDFFGNLRKSNGSVDAGAVESASNVNSPILNSVSPSSGARGAAVNVTLSGQYLSNASAISVTGNGGGVTVSNIVVVNDSSVTATFTIARGATLGQRTVSITTPGGTTPLANAFRVVGATVSFTPAGLTSTPSNRNPKDGTVTVRNTATGANAGPLTLTGAPTLSAGVPPSGSGTFSINPGSTCISGTVLNPGDTCVINVHYAPPAAPASMSTTMRVNLPNTGATTSPAQSGNITGN
jgi:hypothetical protein